MAGAEQAVGDGFLEGLPGRGDDVLVHAHRVPGPAGSVVRLDQDAGHRAGAVAPLQDADLVVGQLQARQLGVHLLQADPQRLVQGVDWAVALPRGDDALALGGQLDGRLADDLAVRPPLDDDAPRLHREVPFPPGTSSSRSSSSNEASAASKV